MDPYICLTLHYRLSLLDLSINISQVFLYTLISIYNINARSCLDKPNLKVATSNTKVKVIPQGICLKLSSNLYVAVETVAWQNTRLVYKMRQEQGRNLHYTLLETASLLTPTVDSKHYNALLIPINKV